MGNSLSNLAMFFYVLLPAPAPRWTPGDMPDMAGKVVIVTGGNIGIGRETVRPLLARGAKVYLACRSRARTDEAIADLRKDMVGGAEALFLELDLADLASVRRCASEFLSQETRLDILFNNAGVASAKYQLTPDGLDLQFGTNVVGHWLLTELLTPALIAATEGGPSPNSKARVVTVSSAAAYLRGLDFNAFVDSPQRSKIPLFGLYAQSKFGNAVVAKELARRHGDKIVSIALHPGSIYSELSRDQPALIRWILSKIFHPVPIGAVTSLYAGTAPEAAELNGQFLTAWARVGTPPRGSNDPALGEKLWKWLEERTMVQR